MAISDQVIESAVVMYQANWRAKDPQSIKICDLAAGVILQQFHLMCKQIAHKYKKYCPIDDLIQTAYMGLLEGVKLYDLDKSLGALSSYLYRSISSHINQNCLKFTVGVGRSCAKRASVARSAMEKGETFDQVAARLGWSKSRKRSVAQALKVSETCGISPEMELADRYDAEQQREREEEWNTVQKGIEKLDAKGKNLVVMIYKDMPIKDQMEVLGLSRHNYLKLREKVLTELSR